MGIGRQLSAAGLLALAVSGCAAPGAPATGGARLVLPAGRSIQYVSADVRALQVTIRSLGSSTVHQKVFPGTALVPDAGGSRFGFQADNLAPGSYSATLEAFLDADRTRSLGSVRAGFVVTAFATTVVPMPSLVLASTPVGDWRLVLDVTLAGGFSVSDYATQLETPAGVPVAGPTGSTLGTGFTWGNVAAEPAGVSTSSVTVTATNKRGRFITKTQVATTSIVSGATVTSALGFAFP